MCLGRVDPERCVHHRVCLLRSVFTGGMGTGRYVQWELCPQSSYFLPSVLTQYGHWRKPNLFLFDEGLTRQPQLLLPRSLQTSELDLITWWEADTWVGAPGTPLLHCCWQCRLQLSLPRLTHRLRPYSLSTLFSWTRKGWEETDTLILTNGTQEPSRKGHSEDRVCQ